MIITVATLLCHRYHLKVDPSDTVLDLKKQIEAEHSFKRRNIRMIFAGKRLCDENTLAHYSIREDSVIHMILRMDVEIGKPPIASISPESHQPKKRILKEMKYWEKEDHSTNLPRLLLQAENHCIVQVRFPNTPWEEGVYYLWLQWPQEYPFKPLNLRFLTPIAHPLVVAHHQEERGCIFASVLSHGWAPSITFEKVLAALPSLPADEHLDEDNPWRLVLNLSVLQSPSNMDSWVRRSTRLCPETMQPVDFTVFQKKIQDVCEDKQAQFELFQEAVQHTETHYRNAFQRHALGFLPDLKAHPTKIYQTCFTFALVLKRVVPDFPRDLKILILLTLMEVSNVSSFWDLFIG